MSSRRPGDAPSARPERCEGPGLGFGWKIPVRLPGRADQWLFVTHATEIPPFVWVVLAERVERAKAKR
jgi:hypothetical protein